MDRSQGKGPAMRNRATHMFSGIIAATMLSAPVLAEKGPEMFKRADKDGDGFLSKAEFLDGHAMLFSRLDTNGDGNLGPDELTKARNAEPKPEGEAPPEGAPPPEGQPPRGLLKHADANGDGTISRKEFTDAGDKMFARLDENGDGKLAMDEMPHRRKPGQSEPPPQ